MLSDVLCLDDNERIDMETDAYDDDVPVCSSCEDAQKDYARLEGVTNNLAAIVRRLAHAIREVSPDHDLPGKALDYLKREGFAGQPLRKVGASNTARPPTPTGWSDTDWLKHLQEQHPLSGLHINQGSMDAAADAYEAEYSAAKEKQ